MQQFTALQRQVYQHIQQQLTPHAIVKMGVVLPRTAAHLEESPLFNSSTVLSAIDTEIVVVRGVQKGLTRVSSRRVGYVQLNAFFLHRSLNH